MNRISRNTRRRFYQFQEDRQPLPDPALALPAYETTVTFAHGNIHTVSLVPLTRGGLNYNLAAAQEYLALTLQSYTRDRVSEETGWTAYQTEQRIHGFVQITNQVNPGQIRRHTIHSLQDITQNRIDEMFEQFQQSETTIEFEFMEWSVVINPQSYAHGAGIIDITKLKYDNRNSLSWKNYSDDLGPINCAAISLAIAMKCNTSMIAVEGRRLQTELGWGSTITISQLADFTAKYPRYRLTCLTAIERSFAHNTFTGSEFDSTKIDPTTSANSNPFILYVYFDHSKRHFIHEKHPAAMYNSLYNVKTYRFCHRCVESFKQTAHRCTPDSDPSRKLLRYTHKEKCEICHKEFAQIKAHHCLTYKCRNCKALIPKNTSTNRLQHRCAIMVTEKACSGYWDGKSKHDKNKPGLWVYDFESSMTKVEVPYYTLYDFKADDKDILVPVTKVTIFEEARKASNRNIVLKHSVNLCVLRNVITHETFIYEGYSPTSPNPIEQMISQLLNCNNGDHIILAHNGSGYDSRMIYNYVSTDRRELKIYSINNGSKFLQLQIKSPMPGSNLIFRDTLLHFPMSLRKLAVAFNESRSEKIEILKGHFPHLFMEFQRDGILYPAHEYSGPIPDLKYFNTTFSCNSEEDYQELLEFHKSWEGKIWDYKTEHIKYCIEDVNCLEMIVIDADKDNMETFELSAWKFVTMPAFISYAFKVWLTRLYDLPEPDHDSYLSRVEQCAQDYWCIDKPQEYAFTKLALRGGSTDTRRLYYAPLPGEEIIYIDQNSQYPAQQIDPDRQFSRGPPECFIYDPKFTPCFKHRNSIEMCYTCPKDDRYSANSGITIHFEKEQISEEDILKLTPNGVIHCRVFVPDMFHPPLMIFDGTRALSPCGEFEGAFNIFNIQDAIKVGVKILETHRIDMRKSGPSLWRDFMIPLYMKKECASKNMPNAQERSLLSDSELADLYKTWDKMISDWEERALMGEDIREALENDRYKKNTVIKTINKFRINNIWGKNAENPVKSTLVTCDTRILENIQEWYKMFEECSAGILDIQSCIPISDDRHLYKIIKKGAAPNLSKGYLPSAVEVPAYGRQDQWVQRQKIGKDVLYYDTDSIALIHRQGSYCPPVDNLIRGWEFEKDYAVGIKEMVAPAPKNYALLLRDGTEVVKSKGVRVGRGTKNIVNFYSMKKNTLDAMKTGQDQTILVPQQIFVNRLGVDMRTMIVAKKMTATVTNQKGPVDVNGLIYPRGYSGEDFVPLLNKK